MQWKAELAALVIIIIIIIIFEGKQVNLLKLIDMHAIPLYMQEGKGSERLLSPRMIIYLTLSKDTSIPHQLSEFSFGCMTVKLPCNEVGEQNNELLWDIIIPNRLYEIILFF